jgi:hypothetical protein
MNDLPVKKETPEQIEYHGAIVSNPVDFLVSDMQYEIRS